MRFFWPNPITAQTLTAAGWTPSRRVDITDWIDRLEAEGFHVSPRAAAILESFGNLAIHPPERPAALWPAEPIFFDPIDVANGMYDRYADFESTLGHHMTPPRRQRQRHHLPPDPRRRPNRLRRHPRPPPPGPHLPPSPRPPHPPPPHPRPPPLLQPPHPGGAELQLPPGLLIGCRTILRGREDAVTTGSDNAAGRLEVIPDDVQAFGRLAYRAASELRSGSNSR
ncbi:SUKH-3 domain-containing protein [Nocardia seriolae]|uniref:Formin-like protein n=1 Tax=Nocardia seriolae TaxID=37332 RepID=A0ABC8AST6_9NOCA|nr:Formin-like protein [Nocardia seriolae]MTJ62158.1 hypothetical protein [Nocardia seriolae]MTJ75896.1 hypothetical protein [Nocardia seriolae]MTJ87070.1 hypothetical protein [Nocardia seriolae]MTK31064.1 hypothetical protein [Nocardia seriolae]